ncbi:MAG: YibE/F family protein [Eubacteriales bacterium]
MKLNRVLLFFLFTLFVFSGKVLAGEEGYEDIDYNDEYDDEQYKEENNPLYDGKVVSIIEEKTNIDGYENRTQVLKVKVLEGDYKDQLVEVNHNISEMFVYNVELNEGDEVILFVDEGGWHIFDMRRDTKIFWIVGIFIIVLLVIGGWKGFKSLVSLIITLVGIIGVFLPSVIKGYDPLIMSIGISICVTLITILLISGFNIKSLSAIIGTSIGVVCAGVLALIFGNLSYLTGLYTEEAQNLTFIPQATQFNFKNLLFAGILLGTLGAVMDVCISIASSIKELYEANPLLTVKKLFVSGMNIGRDIMGTMTNTLILAYVGSSLHLMILFLAYETPRKEIINNELVSTEIIRSVAGTIGLILSIPITAIVTAILIKKFSYKDDLNQQ